MPHPLPFSRPKFALGRVRITPAATAALEATANEGAYLLHRHLSGDWGNIDAQDILQNEVALLLGMRIFSRYVFTSGIEIWIVTEADRSMTTLVSPSFKAVTATL